MEGKWALDCSIHWMPKRKQYRFRFLRYWGNVIYCWYYYFPSWFSREFHKSKKSWSQIMRVCTVLAILEVSALLSAFTRRKQP